MVNFFIKRSWGFHPETWPVVSFGKMHARDELIAKSQEGDKIAFVGTLGEETAEEDRGLILGIAEFGKKPINNTEGLIREINPSLDNTDPRIFDKNGKFNWPFSLPMLKAWRFTNQPELKSLMQQLPIEARYSAVLLSEEDKQKIFSLPSQEVELPDAIQNFRDLNNGKPPHSPTTGPQPASGTWEITHTSSTEPASTYALQFGSHDLWKIGLAKDVKKRLADINKHIPHEVIGEQWEIAEAQAWPTGLLAYKMEQSVLKYLEKHRTTGERVQCGRRELLAAWKSAWLEIT